MPKITPTIIRNIVPPATGKAFVWCSTLPGFGVRTLPSGRSVYVVRYRTTTGTERTMALARCTDMAPDDARELAREVFADVRRGSDPARTRDAARKAPTVKEMADRFMAEHAANLKPGTANNYSILWRKHIVPSIGRMKVAEVQYEDVLALHTKMSKATPTNANHALEVLKKAFDLAEVWRWREKHSNPCLHVKANTEVARERVLTPVELKRLWDHLDAIDPQRQQPVPVLVMFLLRGQSSAAPIRHRRAAPASPAAPSSPAGRALPFPLPALPACDLGPFRGRRAYAKLRTYSTAEPSGALVRAKMSAKSSPNSPPFAMAFMITE